MNAITHFIIGLWGC